MLGDVVVSQGMTSFLDAASPAHRFAVEFANAVTTRSLHRYDWVARRGEFTIYNLILNLAPVVRYYKSFMQTIQNLTHLSCQGIYPRGLHGY